ncbi:uncharacterized protein [Rutidosis leptorrhynchoides]|uniref:uncharacterized protein n=1 Tax=Rutidosis leptorrhynchoides TaxID=125765 RepID=UPI003A9923C3
MKDEIKIVRVEINSSGSAYQLIDMVSELSGVNLSSSKDGWSWSISSDRNFNVANTRRCIDISYLQEDSVNIYRVKLLPRKVNVFLSRFVLDRLSTRLNISSRGLEINDIRCLFCSHSVESLSHLLFSCDIASGVWRKVRLWTDIQLPTFDDCDSWFYWYQSVQLSSGLKLRIYNIVAALVWILWKYRNAFLFDPSRLKKQVLFDLIRMYSYNWLSDIGHVNISWNDWLIKPL